MNNFSALVINAMQPPLQQLGYALRESSADLVRYESTTNSLAFRYGNRGSREITVGLRSGTVEHGPDFSFDEMLGAMSVPVESRPEGYAVNDEPAARHLLARMASLMESYCAPLLRGDPSAWLQLAEDRESAARAYSRDTTTRQALAEAAVAWEKRDWRKFVDLLEESRANLTELDQAKLVYAERQLRPQ